MRIGEITFGVNFDTSSLKPGIQDIRQYRQEVNQAAKSQTTAGQTVAKAMAAQEIAMRKALMTAQNLQASMRRVADKGQLDSNIKEVAKSFNRLTEEVRAADGNIIKIKRSFQTFTEQTNKGRDSLTKFNAGLHTEKGAAFTKMMRNLESSTILAIGPLSGVGARLRTFGALASRTTIHTLLMITAFTALAVVAGLLTHAMIENSKVWTVAMGRLRAATGSVVEANESMKFVIATSTSLGLNIAATSKSFAQLTASARGTSLEGEGVKKVFLGVATAAAALRLEGGDVEGIFRALGQMMSKGTVQAEELRGQLGDRLPGAFKLWADSMHITTEKLNEMMKAGEVFADRDVLGFANILQDLFAPAAAENVNTYAGAMENLNTAWFLFTIALDKSTGLTGALVGLIHGLTDVINLMTAGVHSGVKAFLALAIAMLPFTGGLILRGFTAAVGLFKILRTVILGAAEAQWLFNIAMTVNPIGGLTALILKLVGSILLLVAAWYGLDLVMDDVGSSLDDVQKKLKDGVNETDHSTQSFKDFTKQVDDLVAQLDILNRTNATPGGDIDKAFRFQTAMAQARGLAKDIGGVEKAAAQLANILNHPVMPTVEGVGFWFSVLAERVYNAQKAMDDFNKAKEDKKKFGEDQLQAFKDAREQIDAINEKVGHMGSADELDYYNTVTLAINNFVKSLDTQYFSEQQILALKAEMTTAIMAEKEASDTLAATKERNIAADKAAAAEAKARIAELNRMAKAMQNAREETDLLAQKVAAMASGPNSLRIFEEIEGPMTVYINKLKEAGKLWEETAPLIAEHRRLLEEQVALTGEWAQAGVQGANAIGDALEGVLDGTNSLKEGFKGLLEELWKILLRLLIIDPLVESLSTSMGNWMAQKQTGGGSGGGGGGIFKWLKLGMQAYSAFGGGTGATVGGSGGQSPQQFYGMGGGSSGSGDAIGLGDWMGIGLASGGPVRPGKIHRVAEQGPEMFYSAGKSYLLSGQEGRVVPTTAGTGGTHITVNLPPAYRRDTADQTATAVARVQRRAAMRNR